MVSVIEGPALARRLLVRAVLPGYDLPLEATVVLVERFARRPRGWDMTLYQYDYHREPKPTGRRAHHWHDGTHHIHCVDPMRAGADHYRGFAVDALEVVREFREIHAAGRVSCAGLYPLLR